MQTCQKTVFPPASSVAAVRQNDGLIDNILQMMTGLRTGPQSEYLRPWVRRKRLRCMLEALPDGGAFWTDMTIADLKAYTPDMNEHLTSFDDSAPLRDIMDLFRIQCKSGPLLLPMAACLWADAHNTDPSIATALSESQSQSLYLRLANEYRQGSDEQVWPCPATMVSQIAQSQDLQFKLRVISSSRAGRKRKQIEASSERQATPQPDAKRQAKGETAPQAADASSATASSGEVVDTTANTATGAAAASEQQAKPKAKRQARAKAAPQAAAASSAAASSEAAVDITAHNDAEEAAASEKVAGIGVGTAAAKRQPRRRASRKVAPAAYETEEETAFAYEDEVAEQTMEAAAVAGDEAAESAVAKGAAKRQAQARGSRKAATAAMKMPQEQAARAAAVASHAVAGPTGTKVAAKRKARARAARKAATPKPKVIAAVPNKKAASRKEPTSKDARSSTSSAAGMPLAALPAPEQKARPARQRKQSQNPDAAVAKAAEAPPAAAPRRRRWLALPQVEGVETTSSVAVDRQGQKRARQKQVPAERVNKPPAPKRARSPAPKRVRRGPPPAPAPLPPVQAAPAQNPQPKRQRHRSTLMRSARKFHAARRA